MLFLQPQDYHVNQNGQLCQSLKGFSLVFYTADRCVICKRLKPQFNRLSKTIQGCTFAYMDVDQENMQIRKMAARAGMPIDHVPILLLYLDGVPTAVFNFNEKSNNFGEDLRQWLIRVTSDIIKAPTQPKQSSTCGLDPKRDSGRPQPPPDRSCPTSIGMAKPSGRRNTAAYKTYNGAYNL